MGSLGHPVMNFGKQSAVSFNFCLRGLFSLGFGCFSFHQGVEREEQASFQHLEHCRIPPLPLTATCFLYFFSKEKCWIGNVQVHQPNDRMLATIRTPQEIFGEKKKSWSGEWKKDNLRARPTIGKHSTGTSESEFPYQVFKIGKSIFSLSLGPCQSFERHQKLVNLFIFLFFP